MKGIKINEALQVRKTDTIADTSGTFLVGQMDTYYSSLKEVFGLPNSKGDEYKTDVEWILETPSGVATIYNYKDGNNYLGTDGIPVRCIREWHIGGKSLDVVKWIERALTFNVNPKDLPF